MIKKQKVLLLVLSLVALLVSCSNSKNISDEKVVKQFLNNVYSTSQEDVKQYEKFINFLTNEKLSDSKNDEITDLDSYEEVSNYLTYLKNKYDISEELMKKLMLNRQADYYIKKSYQQNVLYKPENVDISYNESMKCYDYELKLDDKILKGQVRLEDGVIADCNLELDDTK